MTKIYYFASFDGNPVRDFIEKLQKPQKKKVFKILGYIEKYGLESVYNHVKKLTGTPFWEIRILGKVSTRIIYAVVYKGDVLALHAFVKKTQKTPQNHIQTSIERYKSWSKADDA